MLAGKLADHDDGPVDDHIVLLPGATWADFERTLEMRGDRPVPRLAYLEGVLQLMSPSREHEYIKSTIGRLLEVWCLERAIEFRAFGSWTLERKDMQRGVEPDECYVFGDAPDPERPDLAIEVVWTRGGIDKRDIYRALGVHELWFWRRGRLSVHVLKPSGYEEIAASEVLAGIDLERLCSFLDRPTASRAIRDYRAALAVTG